MKPEAIAKAVEDFVDAAVTFGDAAPGRLGTRLLARMRKSWERLYACGVPGRVAFRRLLQDPSPHVRIWVAAQLLAEGSGAEREAVRVLKEIETHRGTRGFNAGMTLKVWRAVN
jgi:hypothetical protein